MDFSAVKRWKNRIEGSFKWSSRSTKLKEFYVFSRGFKEVFKISPISERIFLKFVRDFFRVFFTKFVKTEYSSEKWKVKSENLRWNDRFPLKAKVTVLLSLTTRYGERKMHSKRICRNISVTASVHISPQTTICNWMPAADCCRSYKYSLDAFEKMCFSFLFAGRTLEKRVWIQISRNTHETQCS